MNKKELKELEDLVEKKRRTLQIGSAILLLSMMVIWYLPLPLMIAPIAVSVGMIAWGWNWRKYEDILIEEEN